MLISHTLRPGDQIRFDTSWYGLAPIAGFQMDLPAVKIGDLLLVRCNRAEWEVAERGYMFKDWHADYYEANPVFLYLPLDHPIEADEIRQLHLKMNQAAAHLITACRLYKTGHLLEPIYTANFLISEGLRFREVGPYRNEYLTMPLDGMKWPLEENESEELSQIYLSLLTLEKSDSYDFFQTLIDQFNLSFTPVITESYSLNVLFSLIAMLFGDLRKDLALNSNIFQRFYELARLSFVDEMDESKQHFYTTEMFQLRNDIHHHTQNIESTDLNKAKFLLHIPLMIGLRLLIKLLLIKTEEVESYYASLGWENYSAKEKLNASLDRLFHGDEDPINTLYSFNYEIYY